MSWWPKFLRWTTRTATAAPASNETTPAAPPGPPQHVYVSRLPVLGSEQGTTEMRYRGEAGPNDDVPSFRAKMAALGHVVVVLEERAKREREHEVVRRRPTPGPTALLRDLR